MTSISSVRGIQTAATETFYIKQSLTMSSEISIIEILDSSSEDESQSETKNDQKPIDKKPELEAIAPISITSSNIDSNPQDACMPDLDDANGDIHTANEEKENDSSSSSSNEDEMACTNHGVAFIPSFGKSYMDIHTDSQENKQKVIDAIKDMMRSYDLPINLNTFRLHYRKLSSRYDGTSLEKFIQNYLTKVEEEANVETCSNQKRHNVNLITPPRRSKRYRRQNKTVDKTIDIRNDSEEGQKKVIDSIRKMEDKGIKITYDNFRVHNREISLDYTRRSLEKFLYEHRLDESGSSSSFSCGSSSEDEDEKSNIEESESASSDAKLYTDKRGMLKQEDIVKQEEEYYAETSLKEFLLTEVMLIESPYRNEKVDEMFISIADNLNKDGFHCPQILKSLRTIPSLEVNGYLSKIGMKFGHRLMFKSWLRSPQEHRHYINE